MTALAGWRRAADGQQRSCIAIYRKSAAYVLVETDPKTRGVTFLGNR